MIRTILHGLSREPSRAKSVLALTGARGITAFSTDIMYGVLPVFLALWYGQVMAGVVI